VQYFKNVELAGLYHVSEKTIRNWIESAQRSRVELELYDHNSKTHIANTTKNKLLLEELVERGKKHRPALFHKTAKPSPEFYKLYNTTQVVEIAASIDTYREIPLKFSYFDGGAAYWDQYMEKLAQEPTLNMLTGTGKLLALSEGYIDSLIGSSKRVNVIDLGPGNALPAKDLLAYTQAKGVLGRYIGVDLSESMLNIARRNIATWFGDLITMETYIRDFETEQFNDSLVGEYFGRASDNPVNLVLLFGGTLTNFRSPVETLQVVRRSMGKNDLLLYNDKLDTPDTRRYFDFGIKENKNETLSSRHRIVLDLLNIDESCYEVEQSFDSKKHIRSICIRLKLALSLKFEIDQGERTIHLDKGETILIWRALHQNGLEIIQQFDASGFRTLHTSTTMDGEYFFSVAGVKTGMEE
jgi:uncharacterized SAM-dependent methyltransferase